MIIKEVKYDYSCIMADAPKSISDIVLNFSKKNIPDSVLVINDDAKGREDEIHVTVKFGLLERKPSEKLLEILRNFRPFEIKIGPISFFRNGKTKGFDVVKCGIVSPNLYELNRQISLGCPHEDTYPTYKPHLTLAYVQPGSCSELDGKSIDFGKNKWTVKEVVFSGNGEGEEKRIKTKIPLFSINYKDHFKN